MSVKSEKEIEDDLVKQLEGLGYESVKIPDEIALIANFRNQLNKHNRKTLQEVPFTDAEFAQIMTELGKNRSVFDASKFIRDKFLLFRDDGTKVHIEFANTREWCQNLFQVTQQTTMINGYTIRYDVVLLINGLPLVHIELKKTGISLLEAYGQVVRYQKQASSLFKYAQLYIISNGVNTRYMANNPVLPEFQNLFTWSDKDNVKANELHKFADTFLEKCFLAKMLFQYIVFHETSRRLMVLRPYQVFAVEKLVGIVAVNALPKNGFIWHTTGSGKTLTAFKASQILVNIPHVDKVLFVVDRNDLDDQTQREFNAFSPGSVDGTDNTNMLIRQLKDPSVKLIITTIQKLNNAVKRSAPAFRERVANQRTVLLFDECHRTQFGDTHDRIDDFFKQKNMFGFTGTPIFAVNSVNKKTTKDLFGEQLHEYLIKDAINDGSVLGFSVEYVGTEALETVQGQSVEAYLEENGTLPEPPVLPSYKSEAWRQHVVEYIIRHHKHKTVQSKTGYAFNSIFAVSSVASAIEYYKEFRKAIRDGRTELKVATVFTYDPNGLPDYASFLSEEDTETGEVAGDDPIPASARDMLEAAMQDYNKEFGTNYSLKNEGGFSAYYMNVQKNMKEKRIDVLIVVNMLLTGFDSKTLNTLYVDKNLRYHSLLQAFSRTNRVLDRTKTHGNIVCFRPLKQYVDESIALYADRDASTLVIRRPYHELRDILLEQTQALRTIAETPETVDSIQSEVGKVEFATAFSELLTTYNEINMYSNFSTDEPWGLDVQEFLEYKTKYLDLKSLADRLRDNPDEADNPLVQFDFNLVSLQTDNIDVDYILALLADLKREEGAEEALANDIAHIRRLVHASPNLAPKKDLMDKYLDEEVIPVEKALPPLKDFTVFLAEQRERTIETEATELGVPVHEFNRACNRFAYDGILDKEALLKISTYNDRGFLERQAWKKRLKYSVSMIHSVFG